MTKIEEIIAVANDSYDNTMNERKLKLGTNLSFKFIYFKFKVDCETDAKNCFADNSKWLLSRSNFFVDGRKISKFQADKLKTQVTNVDLN